jgi:putative transposase
MIQSSLFMQPIYDPHYFPSAIIMQALRYYLAYKLSCREIEEIFTERNIHFDHSTLDCWVIKYALPLEAIFRRKKRKYRVLGGWMRPTSKLKASGFTIIEPLINTVR